jgi:hypothetical protein
LLRPLAARLAPPAILALPPLLWVFEATRRASYTSFGRDQGIFQYVAWAIAHGARDYRDVRDVNGPLTHVVHLVFQALGGADEHRFRVLDFVCTGVAFALVGACLPSIASSREKVSWVEGLAERAAWALAGWVVLSGQLLLYIFWDLAQRESFFDWFLLASLGLQLVAQRRLREGQAGAALGRGTATLLGLTFALSVVPWFGKPTYALFTAVQLVTLLVDDLAVPRPRRLRPVAVGAVLGALPFLVYLVVWADPLAFARIYFVDVPAMYRFMWSRTAAEIFGMEGNAQIAALSLVGSTGLLGLIATGHVPRRALAIAAAPLVGLLNVTMQAKGFPYHFHPVTAGLHLEGLLVCAWLAAWAREQKSDGAQISAFAAAAALSLKIAWTVPFSPHGQALWIAAKGTAADVRESHDYLVYFQTVDFFPWEMRETAEYLRAHTRPDDAVQIYGMDPYVLFLARRRSASPYIYAYDLNADAALDGGVLPEESGGLHPNGAEQAKIRAIRDAHEKDLLAHLVEKPPAAWVFFDRAPLMSYGSAMHDFEEHCPDTAAWFKERYVEGVTFGDDHVYVRRDLAETPTAGGDAHPVP